MSEKYINIKTDKDYRIIAISDIHGHSNVLVRLIEKVNLKDEDYLVIVGDFINKGPDSYEALRTIQKLNERKNTIILKGNHELFIHSHMNNLKRFEHLCEILKELNYETIIHAMCNQMGTPFIDYKDTKRLYSQLMSNYKDEFNYISNLPIVAVIDQFRFVHGGYDPSFDIEKDEVLFLKYDDYNEFGKINDLTTITGHWPICNLHHDKISNEPYFNNEKNMVFIDGALGVKRSGELNALIISKNGSKIHYECFQENEFLKGIIISDHLFKDEERIYVNYPHYEIEVIEIGQQMTRCRHVHTQKEFTIFNSLLNKEKNGYSLKTTFVNNFLNLQIGDQVEICSEFEDCVLVKYKGEFGWILKKQLNIE